MSTDETATVTITLRCGADPIEGFFRGGSETGRPFHGWLELTSLLRAAVGCREPDRPSAGDGQ